MTPKKLVNPAPAKSKWYRGMLGEIQKEKVCPLCPQTMRWHTKPILKRRNGWLLTENFNPYKDTAHHLLVISPVHKEMPNQLTRRDWSALSHLLNWAVKKFRVKGGGITMRFGESVYTGATVRHLHLHLIVPKLVRGKAKPVYFPIG